MYIFAVSSIYIQWYTIKRGEIYEIRFAIAKYEV